MDDEWKLSFFIRIPRNSTDVYLGFCMKSDYDNQNHYVSSSEGYMHESPSQLFLEIIKVNVLLRS